MKNSFSYKVLFLTDISLLSFMLLAFNQLSSSKEAEVKLKAINPIPKVPVTLAITHASLGNNILKNAIFWSHSARIVSSLSQHPGLIAYKIKINVWNGEAWTLTIWENEASLNKFVESRTHQAGITKSYSAMKFAEFLRMNIPYQEIPLRWTKIKELMQKQGRRESNY